jgi:HD superfamily phosphohydrolase
MINQIREEMIYTRRFGAFMPVASLATTLIVTYLIKPLVECWFPRHWGMALVMVGLGLLATIYGLIWWGNFCLIRFSAKADFRPRLIKRWREVISGNEQLPAEDYIDKAADVQIRVSMPTLVRNLVIEMSAEQESARLALQQTVDRYAEKNDLRAFVKVLGNQWRLSTEHLVLRPPLLIDDPIHGAITLDSCLSTLIAEPIVQRLNRVRQLSFSYTHFPSATHSRLSHVLGVAHNVDRALTGIFSRGVYYEEGKADPVDLPKELSDRRGQIIQRAKALAILHDLGHGPFGHALDNYVGYVNSHQKVPNPDKVYSRLYIERYLSSTLRKLGFDPDDLLSVLSQDRLDLTGFDPLIGDLIDSSMDMDRMDYLLRDAHMTGLSMGFTNADALIQCVRPLKVGDAYLLAYEETGVHYTEHLFYAREAMYRSCYEHPRKRSAERLLERLVREITQDDPEFVDDLYLLTDEELLCALRLVNLRTDRAKRLLEQLTTNAPYDVIHEVQSKSDGMSDELRTWVRGATVTSKGWQSYIVRPAEWEEVIATNTIGAERSFEVLIIAAPPAAYELKFDSAQILFKDSGIFRTKKFFELASGVKNVLSEMNTARARIKVMCSSGLSLTDRSKIRQASIEQLGS